MKNSLSRRDWLRLSAAGVCGIGASGWLRSLAADAADNPQRKRSCILLWMAGGPSQMDTFDLKPGHANGGPYKAIDTAAPGVRIGEYLPKLAAQMKHVAVVRSMVTKEGDHGRATYLLRTGNAPQEPVQYPALGALVAKELGDTKSELPNFISIASRRFGNGSAYGAGFLGPRYAPLVVGDSVDVTPGGPRGARDGLKVQDLKRAEGVSAEQAAARAGLLAEMSRDFLDRRPDLPAQALRSAYESAQRLMSGKASRAFNLDEEPAALRDAYGRGIFGQGCLLARRLVERGVPFVEVSLGGWDTHQRNFDRVGALCDTLDPAWATLLKDLKDHGLLDTTLVVWMGEFGRTPKINPQDGRDHFPNAWSVVLSGGGIKGGQVVGKTSDDGMEVKDRPVRVPDLLATVCQAIGVDHTKANRSNIGRPIRIVDKSAKPLTEVLA
jgi:hypothetical protein